MIKQIGTYKFLDNDHSNENKTTVNQTAEQYIIDNVYQSGFNYDELKKYIKT